MCDNSVFKVLSINCFECLTDNHIIRIKNNICICIFHLTVFNFFFFFFTQNIAIVKLLLIQFDDFE